MNVTLNRERVISTLEKFRDIIKLWQLREIENNNFQLVEWYNVHTSMIQDAIDSLQIPQRYQYLFIDPTVILDTIHLTLFLGPRNLLRVHPSHVREAFGDKSTEIVALTLWNLGDMRHILRKFFMKHDYYHTMPFDPSFNKEDFFLRYTDGNFFAIEELVEIIHRIQIAPRTKSIQLYKFYEKSGFLPYDKK